MAWVIAAGRPRAGSLSPCRKWPAASATATVAQTLNRTWTWWPMSHRALHISSSDAPAQGPPDRARMRRHLRQFAQGLLRRGVDARAQHRRALPAPGLAEDSNSGMTDNRG
ncbi:hypothetical protein GCM10018773_29950 [Streptomyces candidus]|nr:hypothetical protein GCM10018773_29950 [Streptomyces candidus]